MAGYECDEIIGNKILSAGIAHEIKNPLAIILQESDYLQTIVTDNRLLIQVVESMNKAVHRADIIIQGLLNYTRKNPLEQDIHTGTDR